MTGARSSEHPLVAFANADPATSLLSAHRFRACATRAQRQQPPGPLQPCRRRSDVSNGVCHHGRPATAESPGPPVNQTARPVPCPPSCRMTTNRTAIVRFLPVSRSSGIFIARHLAHQSSTVRGLTRSEPIGQAALPPREAAAGRTGVPHKSAIHRSDAENNRSTRGGGCCQAVSFSSFDGSSGPPPAHSRSGSTAR
jgi:hypothetical protein